MKIRNPITAPLTNDDVEEEAVEETQSEEDVSEEDIKKSRKREYKIEKFTITSENINNFVILDDRRMINDGQVRKIHGALIEGKNPIGILIINRKDGKDRLIDGNHRWEAIKRYFEYKKVYSEVKLDCTLKVYENLSPEQEKQLYLDEAKRRNESLDDRLNMFKSSIQIWKSLNDNMSPFPCPISIYPTVSGLKLRAILNALATVRRLPEKEFSPVHLGKDDIIDFAKDVQHDEYILFKEFMKLFIKTYGLVEPTNLFSKSHYLIPLFDIYAMNTKYKDDKTFQERFARIVGRADIMSYINMSNRTASVKIRELMLNYMNKGFYVKEFK